ncbi:unnamed protein product [Cutaneotrichosporon oleaginosum]
MPSTPTPTPTPTPTRALSSKISPTSLLNTTASSTVESQVITRTLFSADAESGMGPVPKDEGRRAEERKGTEEGTGYGIGLEGSGLHWVDWCRVEVCAFRRPRHGPWAMGHGAWGHELHATMPGPTLDAYAGYAGKMRIAATRDQD